MKNNKAYEGISFKVVGDSMDNGSKESYSDGDIVICQETKWEDELTMGDYVVTLGGENMIRRITEHNKEANTLTLHPLSPLYGDMIVSLSDINGLFEIVESRTRRGDN